MGLMSWLKGEDVLSGDETRGPGARSQPARGLPAERMTSGKLVDLLDRPAEGWSQADLVATVMAHLVVWGPCYLGKYRRAGEIVELSPLHPETIRPELEGGRLRFRYSPGTGAQRLLTTDDVTWIKSMSLDGMSGTSPVLNAARVLQLSDELVKHALSYFTVVDSGGVPRPAGVLKVNPGVSEDGRQTKLEGLRAEARQHGILVASGEIDYINIAANLDDSQLHEQRKLVATEVARCFRIPPHMIGAEVGSSLTYSTTEQQSLDFVKYSLMPWLRRIELAISGDRDLAFERQFVRFEVDGLLRADAKTRAEVYEKALDPITGWMDRSEVRRLEDLPPEAPKPPQQQTIEQMLARPAGVANGGRQET
jgi:HK97 family phage portal protein